MSYDFGMVIRDWSQTVIDPVSQRVRSVGQRWVRGGSEVQRFRSKFRKVREVSRRCLSEVIFRLEKEDYVTCPLYYEVRSQ